MNDGSFPVFQDGIEIRRSSFNDPLIADRIEIRRTQGTGSAVAGGLFFSTADEFVENRAPRPGFHFRVAITEIRRPDCHSQSGIARGGVVCILQRFCFLGIASAKAGLLPRFGVFDVVNSRASMSPIFVLHRSPC